MVSGQEGWAVGSLTGILHYTNGEWRQIANLASLSVVAVDMLNEREGWAVGLIDNSMLHYRDGIWEQIPPVVDGAPGWLQDIDMVEEQTGWAVGDYGLILHYQDGMWRKVDSPVIEDQLITVAAPTASEAWASGLKGNLLHYQNGQWQIVDRPGSFGIRSIVMLNENEG